MIHRLHTPSRARCGHAFATMLFAAGLLMLGFASLSAQGIPVVVVREVSTRQLSDPLRPRLVRTLSWEAQRQILIGAGLEVPARPAVQFSLTPRNPYRVPGGYIRLLGIRKSTRQMPWWQPANPDPTGSTAMDDNFEILVHLSRLKPSTRYLLDLSTDSFNPTELDVRTCDSIYGTRIRILRVSGPQHVFITLETDSRGEACSSLRSTTTNQYIFLTRVDVAELGPIF